MTDETIEKRVEKLERRVEMVEQLPERVTAVELQIVQLRSELRGGFSALRAEMRESNEETIRVVEMLNAETNQRMDARIAQVDERSLARHKEVMRRFSQLDKRLGELIPRRAPQKRTRRRSPEKS